MGGEKKVVRDFSFAKGGRWGNGEKVSKRTIQLWVIKKRNKRNSRRLRSKGKITHGKKKKRTARSDQLRQE